MVLRSDRSRDCATVDMVKWRSISHAISSVSAALKPSRGHNRPRHLRTAIEWSSGRPLAMSCSSVVM